jgi:hypothetical protein
MLTHVHYGETLCGWQYRSKGEVKGVKTLVTGMIGRVRQGEWTRLVFSPRHGQSCRVDWTLAQGVTGLRGNTIPESGHGDVARQK